MFWVWVLVSKMNQDKSRVKEGKRAFKTRKRLKTSVKGLVWNPGAPPLMASGTTQEIARDLGHVQSCFTSPT
jgi:hypothetical protein